MACCLRAPQSHVSEALGCVFLEISFLISTLSTYFGIQVFDFFCLLPTAAQFHLCISRNQQPLSALWNKACQPLRATCGISERGFHRRLSLKAVNFCFSFSFFFFLDHWTVMRCKCNFCVLFELGDSVYMNILSLYINFIWHMIV